MSFTFPLLAIRGMTFGSPALLFVAFAIACIVLAFIVYRHTLPPVGSPRRRLLAFIRAFVLVTILFLIFEPVLRWLDRREERAKIILLVDKSASMAIDDNGIVRDSTVRKFLSRPELKTLVASDELRIFTFADSAEMMSLDSVKFAPPSLIGTNPAHAWTQAINATSSSEIGAVVIISDGAHNSGPNPERAATESRIPIYTVGVGDTTLRRDAMIADIMSNDIAYKGTQVPVRVRIRAQGIAGSASRLRIIDSRSHTLLEETIEFDGAIFEKTFDTAFSAESEGELRLTAVLDSVAGESTLENNRRSRIVRILDSKYNVLIVAGSASPDVTFLRQALGSDTTIDVSAYIESKNGFVGNRSFSVDDVKNAELIVLVDYPTSGSNRQLWESISDRLVQDGAPLLYMHGPHVSLNTLAKIAPRLPVEFQPQASFERVVLRDAGSHPAINARGPLPANWSDLPPTQAAVGKVQLKPSAVQIASFANELTPELPGGPAVVLSELSRRRAAAITVVDSYRWSIGMAKTSTSANFQSELLSRLTAWLLAPTEEKQVTLSTDKRVYSTGEIVRVQGQVYNPDLSPVNDAVVLVDVKQAERSEILSLRSRGNGLYEAQFNAWGPGDYAFSGSAVARADTLGKDNGTFIVETFNLELLDARARWDILAGISRNSGGLFVTAENPDSMFAKISLPSKIVENTREIPLWNRPIFLWVLIGLLGLEWMLRKRNGML